MKNLDVRGSCRMGLVGFVGALLCLSGGAALAQDGSRVTVAMGSPGDRWLDTMTATRVARGQRDKHNGYEVSYRIPDLGKHTFFWPRANIDFQGRSPGSFRQLSMKLGDHRLYYPDTVTARSLPRVHAAILYIEADYVAQARGAMAAARGFADVAMLGTMAPVRLPAPRPRAPARPPVAKPKPSKPYQPSAVTPRCFVAGTPVHTQTGLVAIEDLARGDGVIAVETETGALRHESVVTTFAAQGVAVIEVEVARDDGAAESLQTTAEHPFWVPSRGWVRVEELDVGESLQALDGSGVRVARIVDTGRTATVYNIEVAGAHTYFVGEFGVRVHNKPARIRGIRISKRWRARKVTDPGCQKGCDQVANQIVRHIGGRKFRITADPDMMHYIGRYRGHNFNWKYHFVVVKDGRVYDAFTGYKGLPIAEYKKLWQFGESLLFGF